MSNAQTYSAEVRRTSFGVAHVKATNYGSIGYGVGHAFAQDNFCMIADEFVTVRGERSRYFGESGTTPYQRNNLVSDYYYTLVNADPAPLLAGLDSMSSETRAAFRGWVAGYNRYLRDTGVANLPAPCKGAAWVRPIDDADMMRLVRRYLLEASTNNFMEGMLAAKPPSAASGSSAAKLGPKSDAGIPGFDQDFWPEWRSGIGSNALAVGADGTDNGRGLLLGNPHFPWSGTLRFYQFHVTIPGEIDVMGGALSGFPLINIGFNKDVAWSHTNDVAWHFTLYQLKLDPANPTRYFYDGQLRDMTTKTVTVQVKGADGTLSSKSNTFYFSHFGPVTTSTSVPIPWTGAFAYAIRETNMDNWRLADQWRAINKATSVADIKTALQTIVGIPWVNTTAADREGNAFYGDISTAPNVPREKQSLCTPDVTFAVVFSLKGSGGPGRFAFLLRVGRRGRRPAGRAHPGRSHALHRAARLRPELERQLLARQPRRRCVSLGHSRGGRRRARCPGHAHPDRRPAGAGAPGGDGRAHREPLLAREPPGDRAFQPQPHGRPVHDGLDGALPDGRRVRGAGRVRRALGLGPQVRPGEPRRAPLPRSFQRRAQHRERLPGAIQLPRPAQHAPGVQRRQSRHRHRRGRCPQVGGRQDPRSGPCDRFPARNGAIHAARVHADPGPRRRGEPRRLQQDQQLPRAWPGLRGDHGNELYPDGAVHRRGRERAGLPQLLAIHQSRLAALLGPDDAVHEQAMDHVPVHGSADHLGSRLQHHDDPG
ncbi:MAG: penicillin acylase family protein [Betaproteobacteria bacterium]|nr:penicillin acylase family protein [Betaproteobacteria bacterium]